MNKYVIIVAGGSGKRMNSVTPKQFLLLNGRPVLMYTIDRFYTYDPNINIILVLPSDYIEEWEKLCKQSEFLINHKIVTGGTERFYSVLNALMEIHDDGLIAIHDGVRPLVSIETISRCFDSADKYGNGIPCIDITESVRYIEDSGSVSVDRSRHKLIQTPQVFFSEIIKIAYKQCFVSEFTDDASVVEKMGIKINLVEGNKENIKITTSHDLQIAEALLK